MNDIDNNYCYILQCYDHMLRMAVKLCKIS